MKNLLALFLLLPLAGQAPAMKATPAMKEASATAAVKVDNFTFTPMKLTIKAGTTVTWTNADDVPHTIVAVGGAFRSLALDTGEYFTYTFTKPGLYKYYCSVHPRMVGIVRVVAAKKVQPSRP